MLVEVTSVTKLPPKRTLFIDIENRPLAYWYEGQTTSEITVIAASWLGESHIHVRNAEHQSTDKEWAVMMRGLLGWFVDLYNQADIVTGHYIRKHDLPTINSHLLEWGLPPLAPKLTVDTKLDLHSTKDLSASLENLGALLAKVDAEKIHVSNVDWRRGNRLTREGIALARERCKGDIVLHKEVYQRLGEIGWLKPPRRWPS